MKEIIALITILSIFFNPSVQNLDKENNHPRIIEAIIRYSISEKVFINNILSKLLYRYRKYFKQVV